MSEATGEPIRRGRLRLLPAASGSLTRCRTIVVSVFAVTPTFTLLSFTPPGLTIVVAAGGLFSISTTAWPGPGFSTR